MFFSYIETGILHFMTRIILFDGFCNLCNGSVRFIFKRDTRGLFRFTPIQSKNGQKLLNEFNISSPKTDSLVYIRENTYFLRSDAILEILKDMGGIWRISYGLIVIPKFIRDSIYDLIAKIRYRVFGRKDVCAMHPFCQFL